MDTSNTADVRRCVDRGHAMGHGASAGEGQGKWEQGRDGDETWVDDDHTWTHVV